MDDWIHAKNPSRENIPLIYIDLYKISIYSFSDHFGEISRNKNFAAILSKCASAYGKKSNMQRKQNVFTIYFLAHLLTKANT